MASMRPNPASPSDDPPAIPLGVRVERKHATGPAGQPGSTALRHAVLPEGGQVEFRATKRL